MIGFLMSPEAQPLLWVVGCTIVGSALLIGFCIGVAKIEEMGE